MNIALFMSVVSWFSLMYMPLRLMIVIGLWAVVLQHNEFFNSLGQVIVAKIKNLDAEELLQ